MANVPIINGARNSYQPTPTKPGVIPAGSAVPVNNVPAGQIPKSGQNAVPGQTAPLAKNPPPLAVNPVAGKPKSNSPWDDDIEASETAPINTTPIVGSLDPESAPLKVPENIEEKVGQKVPATDFMGSNGDQGGPTQAVTPPSPKGVQGLLGGLFGKKKTPAPAVNSEGALVPPPIPNVAPTPAIPKAEAKKANPVIKKVLILVPGLIVVFALATLLTEFGLLSIGAENVYGALGVEQLWGGLSTKTEMALGQSALTMQSHPDFKIDGKISITIDRAIKSDVVTPLLSLKSGQSLTRDESINPAQKAIQTASDDYYFTTNGNSNANSNSNLNSNSNRNSNSNSNSIATPPTNANSNSNTNANANSNTGVTAVEETSGTKVVEGIFSLKTSSTSNEAAIKLNDTSKSTVTLVNDSGKLLVKATGKVNYGSTDETKWVVFNLDQLKDESIVANIFNLKVDSGFSVKGIRAGNEKVGDQRCYKYRIDSLEIGSSMADIGITSDMVPTLSGDVWIGIKDKLIHKMSIKITTPVSSAVRMVTVDANFSDFDVKNSVTKVATADQVSPQNLTGDAKRKADVVALLAALKKYKDDNKSYPISIDLMKLNTSDNAVAKALVPRYLTSLPEDSKTADGWYYAYKSADGTKCSISSRLENATDPEGSQINGVLLYLKYSSD